VKPKPTPGPWRLRQWSMGTSVEAGGTSGATCCKHNGGPDSDGETMHEANARLRDAAPDLMDALLYLRAEILNRCSAEELERAVAHIEETIAEAGGEL
jgi:hypothetical protein